MNSSRPSLKSTIAALILLGLTAAACVSLGMWQLDRAEQRKEAQRIMMQGRASAPLTLTADLDRSKLQDWRAITLEGKWRNDLSILLDNRNHNGQPGYWLATPMMLTADNPKAVLVLRGWLPRAFSNPGAPIASLPSADPLKAPSGMQLIEGQLQAQIPRMFELWSLSGNKADTLPAHLPAPNPALPVTTNLTLEDYARITGLQLLPVIVQQTKAGPDSPDTLVREWPEPSLDADKNIGYALQWFGFATIAGGAFLVVAWRARRRRRAAPSS